jgi:hypothetical protein
LTDVIARRWRIGQRHRSSASFVFLDATGIVAPLVLDGPMTGAVFRT